MSLEKLGFTPAEIEALRSGISEQNKLVESLQAENEALKEEIRLLKNEPAEQEPACKHPHDNRSVHYSHVGCLSCGAVYTDNEWGVASNKWFKNIVHAQFYEKNGRLPE